MPQEYNRTTTPKLLKYRMPAEWELHKATWFSWPKDPITWPGCLQNTQETFLEMISHLTTGETVRLLVDDLKTKEEVRKAANKKEIPKNALEIIILETQDAWIRDYGPNFLVSKNAPLGFNHWRFNAWGNKYESLKQDDKIPLELAQYFKGPVFFPEIVLEGGSIDVNGNGSVLTTEQCLLNPNRNPDLSRKEIEQHLKDYLNVDQVLWLEEGIAGDDTDGHIDDLTRFVGPKTIVTALEEDPTSPNYHVLKNNFERLKTFKDFDGSFFEILTLPMPNPLFFEGRPLPASYANFYIGNSVVLVPVFDNPQDKIAIETLKTCFPNRKVIGILAKDLVIGMGACHCLTQQEPLG